MNEISAITSSPTKVSPSSLNYHSNQSEHNNSPGRLSNRSERELLSVTSNYVEFKAKYVTKTSSRIQVDQDDEDFKNLERAPRITSSSGRDPNGEGYETEANAVSMCSKKSDDMKIGGKK